MHGVTKPIGVPISGVAEAPAPFGEMTADQARRFAAEQNAQACRNRAKRDAERSERIESLDRQVRSFGPHPQASARPQQRRRGVAPAATLASEIYAQRNGRR